MALSREIKSPQRQMRMLAFQKSGLGTPALAGEGKLDGTIADNGVGDYTISFEVPFVRIPVCIAQDKTTGRVLKTVCALGSVQVLAFSDVAMTTAAEADFDIICLGSDVADQL
jgi:hypothetical protein